MKHIPFLPEIGHHDSRVAELAGIHQHNLLFLLSEDLVDGHNPTQVIDIAEDDHIVFQAGFLRDLRVHAIHTHAVVQTVAHFD